MKASLYNVDCITADFTRVPHRYSDAHIFFLPPVSNEVMSSLKSRIPERYLQHFQVKYLDFRPLESQVYTLNDPFALEKLYHRECQNMVLMAINKMALQMVSVCASLGEYPIVRFYKPDNPNYDAHMLSFMLAREFQAKLDEYARDHADFPNTKEKRPRSIFLITDRSMDWNAPLLHEFTFQAMAYDLLDFKDWTSVEYQADDKMTERNVSEKDEEWTLLRHKPAPEAIDVLQKKLAQTRQENANLEDKTSKVTASELRDMALALPMYQKIKERLGFYMDIMSQSMAKVQQYGLMSTALVEQTLATELDPERSKPKNIADDLVQALAEKNVTQSDKLRLIILYAIFRRGLIHDDYLRLQQHCGLSSEDLEIISNYTKLGAPLLKTSTKSTPSKSQLPTRYHSAVEGDDFYQHARYVCGLFNVINQMLTGKLSSDIFPYVKGLPDEQEETYITGANSLRNPRQRGTWALNSSTAQAARQRVFIFVAGGMTASEMRSCYELSKKHSREIIIGSNDVTSSRVFLKSLSNLSKPRHSLNLPEDQPEPTKAPAFLFESEIKAPVIESKIQKPVPQSTPSPDFDAQKISTSKHHKPEKEKKKGLKSFFK